MKPIKLTPNITVKATALKNAANLSILIHNDGQNPAIDRTKLKNVVRELVNNPINGFVPNKFIATFHTTPKYIKVNVTVLLRNAETKKEIRQRIKETAKWIIEELCAGS